MKGGIELRGVLFDLDGTLLDIDLEAFLGAYFGALGPVLVDALPGVADEQAGLGAVLDATRAMALPHPGRTNRDAFNERIAELTGADLALEEYALPFERFYAETFPELRGVIGPKEGARAAVEAALELGFSVAIATNPIFPAAAIHERMRWAGVDDLPVNVVTTYEIMHAAKPHAAYFAETASMLGLEPSECLMVGDDQVLDMSAADSGMKTFYVGPGEAIADFHGDLLELASVLTRVARDAD